MPVVHSSSLRFSGSVSSSDAATEVTIANVPRTGFITRIHAVKTSGTAAHLQPVVGRVTNPSGTIDQILLVAASSGIHIDEVPAEKIPYTAGAGLQLYMRLQPNTASDNNISWELYIESGS
tara:strand:- start:452 stop:814 length:363 start_codon:yes stop_codon:yes gene_type:complete